VEADPAGGLRLDLNGGPVCPVRLPDRPAWYDSVLGDGRRAHQLLTRYSGFALATFLRRDCALWSRRETCGFCSVEPTRRLNRAIADQVDSAPLAEAAALAVAASPEVAFMEWSSGAHEDLDAGFRQAIAALREVKARLPRPLIHHLNIMPPADPGLLELLEAVEEPTFALEVWGDERFAEVCPGKQRLLGRRGFLDRLYRAAALLGPGRMSCNFVAGLEPVDELIAGCRTLAGQGVVPTMAIFHPDRGTAYARRSPPAVTEMLRLASALGRIYREHGYRPYMYNCRRSSIDGEVYRGFFDA
jgi:hypothetical protein